MVRYGCRDYACTVEMAFDLVGGKWKARIVYHLGAGTLRFGQLERQLPDTSRKVLVQQLRDLESHGIVRRTVFAEVPPRVEYALTPRGRKLVPIIRALDAWATEILDDETTPLTPDAGAPELEEPPAPGAARHGASGSSTVAVTAGSASSGSQPRSE